MDQRARLGLLVLFACAGVAFFVSSAHAQANLRDPSGSLMGLLDLVQNNANGWAGHLRSYAARLFWMLAVIQFVWTFFPLVIRNSDFGEIVGELVRFILVIGFFYALLLYSVEWATAVVDSFRTAGGAASGLGRELRPGDIFSLAVKLARTIGTVETWNPLVAMSVSIAGLVVLLCFAFIAAFMAVTLVESYIVINASVLFMGFGGGQWTREYSIAMARYAVAVGAKLFVLTLIVGLIIQSANQWQAAYNNDAASMWTMVGLSLVCAYLSKQIPDLVQSLITGTSMGGGHALGGMAMAAAALATAGASAAGAAGAAGASGATGAAAGSAAGSGGLAGLIDSSLSGGGKALASASLDGAASGAGPLAPRTGGAASSAGRMGGGPGPTPSPARAAASAARGQDHGGQQQGQAASGEASTTSESGSTLPQAVTETDQAAQSPAASSTGASAPERPGDGHAIMAGIVRTTGMLAAISVPGMEAAAGLSLGPRVGGPPSVPDGGEAGREPGSDFASDNIIAPAGPALPPPALPHDPDQEDTP